MNEPSERESNDALTRLVERLQGMLESVIKERAKLLVRVDDITHESNHHLQLYVELLRQRSELLDDVASLRSALDIERVNADGLTRERDAAEDLSCDIRTVNAEERAVLNRCDRDRLFLAREVLAVEARCDELSEAARWCRERHNV